MRKLILLGLGIVLSTALALAQEAPKPDAEKTDDKKTEAGIEDTTDEPEETWPGTIALEDFEKSMKAMKAANAELLKAISEKDAEAAEKALKKLEENAGKVRQYDKKDAEGNETHKEETFTKQAKALSEALTEIRKKLAEKDWKEAEAARTKSDGACNTCHKTYDPYNGW